MFVVAALVAMTLGFTSCEKKSGGGGSLDPDKPVVNPDKPSEEQVLSPEESKEKLMDVAKRMVGKFNTTDQKEAIELADQVYDKYEKYSWDELENYFGHRYDALFYMPHYVSGVMKGHMAPTAFDKMYEFSFAGESAIFEADDANKSWKYVGKSDDNSVIMRCKDNNGYQLEAKCWGEGKTKEYEYTWYDSYDNVNRTIKVVLPRKVFFTLTHGKKSEIIRVEFEQDLQKNDHAKFSLLAKVTTLSWTTDVEINSTHGSAAVAFNYGNERLFALAANLPSYKLIDKQDSQSYEDWLRQYEDRYDELLKSIGGGSAAVDIFGEVQGRAKIENGGKLYQDIVKWSDKSSDSKESADEFCRIINECQTNGIYYNSDVKQAEVFMQTTSDGYGYYPEPVMSFPDGTTYAFEAYFVQKPFTDLQKTVEDLVNKYIKLSDYLYGEVMGHEELHF